MNATITALALITISAIALAVAGLIAVRALARELFRWLEAPWGLR